MKTNPYSTHKKEVFNYRVNLKLRMAAMLLFLLFSLYQKANAQVPDWQWARQMAGTNSSGQGIYVDGSGNVYSTGNFWGTVDFDPGTAIFSLSGTGADDGYISKLDASGNFLWAKAFNGVGGFSGIDIATDASGNVYSTGIFRTTSDFDPGEAIYNLTATGDADIYISKLDEAGNFIWAKALYGTEGNWNWSTSLAVDQATGDVYTTGHFYGTVDFDPGAGVFNLTAQGVSDIFISKLDHAGNFLWAISLGSTAEAHGLKIIIDNSGNIYAAGGFQGTVDFDPGPGTHNLTSFDSADVYILKLDASGNFLTALQLAGEGFEFIKDLKIDPANGDIYAAGSFDGTVDFDPGLGFFSLTANGEWDSYIVRLESTGDFVWAKSVGGSNNEVLYSMALDVHSAHRGVYVMGSFSGTVDFDPGTGTYDLSSAGEEDPYIIKLEVGSGDFIWAKRFGDTHTDIAVSMALDNAGYPYLSGFFYSPDLSFATITGTTTFSNPDGNADAFVVKLDTTISTGIVNIESSNRISVYPNPAIEQLNICYPNASDKASLVTISDFTGKIIYQTNTLPIGRLEVNTRDFANGIYLVQIQTEEFRESIKVVIQN